MNTTTSAHEGALGGNAQAVLPIPSQATVTPDTPGLLSIAQAAQRLGIGAETLRRLHVNGESPFEIIRLGGRYKVRTAELETFLKGGDN